MAKKQAQPDDMELGAGGCAYQPHGVTCARTASRDCAKCGWNPDNGVRERRVAKAMLEYALGVKAGKSPRRYGEPPPGRRIRAAAVKRGKSMEHAPIIRGEKGNVKCKRK